MVLCCGGRLKITEGAVKALVRLGGGDMRRVLNVLQVSAHTHTPSRASLTP
jgi:DNA polymerase III delta prime subunit